MKPFFSLISFLFAVSSNAAILGHKPPDVSKLKCSEILSDKLRLVPSGREDEETNDRMYRAAAELFKDGGVYQRLGIARPYQVIQNLPGGELNQIAGVNGMPIAHWRDGQKISQPTSGLLYELVISGKDEHFSFYRDDNPFMEQYSILVHATAGHNHFSETSRYPHFRSTNRIQEAYDLSVYMDTLRTTYGGDEVTRWYQYLLSLNYAQDLVLAQYQAPEDLVEQRPSIDSVTLRAKPGFQPTANILQAFVANPPPGLPEWKVQMAKKYERLQRYIPGAVQTKIMNEGWSTFMQILIPKHTSYNDFDEAAIPYCCLLSGVVRPGIDNPYWLGLEGWKNVYAKFLKRPEIAKMEDWEQKDAAFVKYANGEIISQMNDAEFLKYALDANWVAKNNFALTRAWKEEEYQGHPQRPQPPTQDPKKNWPYSILTRDANEVIEAIVAQVKSLKYSFPRVVLNSLKDQGTGQVTLELSDHIGKEVALDRKSVVETLFVISQLRQQPVALESTFDIEISGPIPPDLQRWFEIYKAQHGWTEEQFRSRFNIPSDFQKQRTKVVVSPDGKVEVYEVQRKGSSDPEKLPAHAVFADKTIEAVEIPNAKIAAQLKEMLDAFDDDLNLGDSDEGAEDPFTNHSLLKALNMSVDMAAERVSPHLQLSMPTVPRALIEYNNFVSRRVGIALKNAINKKKGFRRKSSGVSVKALPNIPYFQFDRRSLMRAMEKTPGYKLPPITVATPIISGFSSETLFRPIDLVDIHPVPGKDGDIIWGPKPQNGNGTGDDDGDGDPTEDSDPNRKPSEDGGDEQFVDVTLEAYAEALSEQVKLPNLRPKEGLDRNKITRYSGSQQKMTGQPVNRLILRNAYRRGFPVPPLADPNDAGNADKVETPQVSPFEGHTIIRKGLAQLKMETDWVVRRLKPKPGPDMNALVVFQMDMSGSMIRYQREVKQLLFDLRVMLMRGYKNVKILYVTFNDKPYVYEDFDQFIKFKADGGTRYAHSFQKTAEIYEKYPASAWDRYPVVAGDMDETLGAEEKESFQIMKDQSQFTTVLRINDSPIGGGFDELTNYFMQQDEDDPFVGFVNITPAQSYSPLIFKRAFKNEQ